MIIPNGFRRHPEGIENDFDKREQRKLAYSAERRNNRRTSEWRAKLARTFLSEEEEDEVKRSNEIQQNNKIVRNELYECSVNC